MRIVLSRKLFLEDPERELERVPQRRVRGEVHPVELAQRETEQLPSEDDEDDDEGSEGGQITIQATEEGDGGGEKERKGQVMVLMMVEYNHVMCVGKRRMITAR